MTTTDTEQSPAELQARAREAYRESVEQGTPLSWQDLGDMFGRSKYWARDRIQEARTESDSLDPTPVVVEPVAPTAAVVVSTPSDNGAAVGEPVTAVVDSAPNSADSAPAVEQPPATVGQTPTVVTSLEEVTTDRTPGDMSQPRGARAVAWLSFVVGIAVSIAANVMHAYYPTAAQLEAWRQQGGTGQWQPEPGAVVGAGFWPLALLLAVEVLSRVRWRPGGWWNLARFGGTGLVAVVAAVLSYRHMAGLLLAFGEDSFSAHLGPLAVDGLMVVAGFALLSMSTTYKK